jgi:hypothetical protein
VDLSTNKGAFALSVGSALGSSKRTANDPAHTLVQIFSNNPVSISSLTCAGYTPAAGDARLLRVTVYSHTLGTTETLSPDLTIGSVPQASVAESLQGLIPSSFLQTSTNATQANIETLVAGSSSDASSLHNHDSRYLKSNSPGSQNIGAGGAYTSGTLGIGVSSQPTTAQLQVSPGSSTVAGIVVQGASGQSADLQDWKNSTGATLAWVDSSGKFHGDGSS